MRESHINNLLLMPLVFIIILVLMLAMGAISDLSSSKTVCDEIKTVPPDLHIVMSSEKYNELQKEISELKSKLKKRDLELSDINSETEY